MKNDFFINSTHSKFIEIRGEERADFLQGLITNDINICKLNRPIYACLLTPQGKFLADFFIINLHFLFPHLPINPLVYKIPLFFLEKYEQ